MTGGDCEWKKSIRELEEKKDIKWTFIKKKKTVNGLFKFIGRNFFTLCFSQKERHPHLPFS